MAQAQSTKFFEKLLLKFIGEEDPLFSMLKWLLNELMLVESSIKVGVDKGKHSRERKTYFSGTRLRRFDTRYGTVYLMVPKLRNGGYIPFFVTERKRSEIALMQVVQEAFINGVSTRKIERLAKALGIEGMSASQVSEINKGLNSQVEEFRNRKLEKEYPVIWVDALYEKIRSNNRVISEAVLVVYGVNREGKRDILTVEPMYDETAGSWSTIFKGLKKRGMENVWLIVSDAHKGIQKAVQEDFTGASWQRCKVHFMRNIMARVSHKHKEVFGERLKQIWLQPDLQSALKYTRQLMDDYESMYPEAIATLEEGLEDSLQFYHFECLDKRKISSTNNLERLNREIRRRTRVVGVFPNRESYIRLVTSYLIEYTDDWQSERSYLSMKSLDSQGKMMAKTA
jgi:transposase-like protein